MLYDLLPEEKVKPEEQSGRMGLSDADQRLSHITTLWTLVRQAHQGPADAVPAAQQTLLERYGGAVHRYLLGALRDPEAADDMFQEFCLRFLRGDFRNADPGRGRFRDFVKTALFHLICDYQRRRQRRPLSLDPDHEPAAPPPDTPEAEQAYLNSWREELMDRTWRAVAELEEATGQPVATVLRFRAEHPLLSSAELAEQLGTRLGKVFSIDGIRQALHRAREKFTDLLLEEVAQSLQVATPEAVEEELVQLGMLSYCRSALERRRQRRR